MVKTARKLTPAQAIDALERHGRAALRRLFPAPRGGIPAARMALEFCRRVGVRCDVVPVLCLIRNSVAKAADVWPWRQPAEKIDGAAIVVVGDLRGMPDQDDDSMHYHIVPVIAGDLVDMTLDAHTDRPELGFTPLPPLVMLAPRGDQIITADAGAVDISYLRRRGDRHSDTPYWRHFSATAFVNAAVAELVARVEDCG